MLRRHPILAFKRKLTCEGKARPASCGDSRPRLPMQARVERAPPPAAFDFFPLLRGLALPSLEVVNHQTQLIDHNLSGKTGAAFVAIAVAAEACIALMQRFESKIWKFDPGRGHVLPLSNGQIETA